MVPHLALYHDELQCLIQRMENEIQALRSYKEDLKAVIRDCEKTALLLSELDI